MKWLTTQINYIDFTLSSLSRRRWKNMALVFVYAVIVFLIASVMFFSSAFRKEALAVLDSAPEIIVQRSMAGRHDLIPLSYIDTIKSIRGVRAVQPRLWGYYYHPASKANYTIMVPDQFAHGERETAIGNGVLRTWKASEGGQLFFRSQSGEAFDLKIADAFHADTDLVASDLILMSEPAFRRLTGMPEGFATDIAVSVRNPKECVNIAKKINTLLPDTRPITREEITRTYASLFDWRSGYVIVLLSGGLLAFFIFAWEKATGLSAEERNEIGILKAVGWNTSDILMLKFWEGGVISLTAFVIGAIGAYIHVFIGSATLFEHALKGWAVVYPSFKLAPSVDAYQIGTLFLLTVMPYSFIVIVPAWKVAITDPSIAMT
jgi:ABC-type lipoprotein release transport system permease subunit